VKYFLMVCRLIEGWRAVQVNVQAQAQFKDLVPDLRRVVTADATLKLLYDCRNMHEFFFACYHQRCNDLQDSLINEAFGVFPQKLLDSVELLIDR
jgi:hypothetical protein